MLSRAIGRSILAIIICMPALCMPALAMTDIDVYAEASTLGFGGGVSYGVTDSVSARVGYLMLNFKADVHTQDLDYDGKFKLGGVEGILDWHPFDNGFRLSGGVIFSRNKIDLDGQLQELTATVNGVPYTVDRLAYLRGNVKFNPVTPYVGIGWGKLVGPKSEWRFIADAGLQYYGSPRVKLKGGCSSLGQQIASATACQQVIQMVQSEEDQLNHQVKDYKWYPVLSFGLAYSF